MTLPEPETMEESASAWCFRLAEGKLSDAEQKDFERWLEADPAHRAAFDAAVSIWRAMEEVSLSPGLIDLRQAALASFRKANRTRWRDKYRRRTLLGLIAATVVAALIGAGLWAWMQPDIYRTGVGERRVIMLSDGSKISLDAQTEVDVDYTRDKRTLRLVHGRAKFDVAKNPLRPFTVAAADKIVVATGTAFSVETLGNTVRVILYEGHVTVLSDRGAPTDDAPVLFKAKSVTADNALSPGRELIAHNAELTAMVVKVDPVRTLAWEGGQLVFADEPLATAVERVNRYSDKKILIADPKAAALLVNGVFTAGGTAAFVEGMTGVLPLKTETRDGQIVLSSAH